MNQREREDDQEQGYADAGCVTDVNQFNTLVVNVCHDGFGAVQGPPRGVITHTWSNTWNDPMMVMISTNVQVGRSRSMVTCRALSAVRSIDLRGLVECIKDALQARQQNEMRDMVTLEGKPRVVARPHSDWQLFEARREIYGGIFDWHTIEGPALRIHRGRYYCFYSGGAWHSSTYGVSYVVAEHPLGPYRRPVNEAPLLKSIPGKIIGPGHNSFVVGPDGCEFIVYHAWPPDMSARLMRIDRLSWHGAEPVLHGPTITPQSINWATT